MNRVNMNTKIVKWALDRSGIAVPLLEKRFPQLQKWMSGEKSPTFKQLNDLAQRVRVPIGYFFLSDPPEEKLPIKFFRTNKMDTPENPSPELIDIVYAMKRRQLWLSEYHQEIGNKRLAFVGSARLSDSAETVAASIIKTLGLQKNWAQKYSTWRDALSHLYRATDRAGINVVANGIIDNNAQRRLNPREFRGFVIVDDYAPIMFVNNSDGKAAQMFTIAHELAHIWFGQSGIFDLEHLQPADIDIEINCNNVAAEFLVPAKNLLDTYKLMRNAPDLFQKLAKMYKVSEIVIARRLLDLRLITKDTFFEFYHEYQRQAEERIKSETGGDFYRNQNYRVGHTFMKAVLQAIGDGSLQYIDAFRLTSLYGKTFDVYANKVMGSN